MCHVCVCVGGGTSAYRISVGKPQKKKDNLENPGVDGGWY